MIPKDDMSIVISLLAPLISFSSLIFVFLNFRRKATKLKIIQSRFAPNPFGTKITPNKLFLDREQSTELWTVVPMLHLVLYLEIANLSHVGITISNLIINNDFLLSKVNEERMEKELSLTFFASENCQNRELEEYGHSVPMAAMTLHPNDYNLIKIGDRIDSKSSIEGMIIASGNWNLYNAIKDGINKLTIVTPDKKFDVHIEIDKTIIPNGNTKNIND